MMTDPIPSRPAVAVTDIERHLDEHLQVARFRDYCPNGLQVEGRRAVGLIASGVTASLALIEAAIDGGADALLVHHGYFWRNEDARLRGIKRERIGRLIGAGLHLLAYHLPLDAHPLLGNHATLARVLGIEQTGTAGDDGLLALGQLAAGHHTVASLARLVGERLGTHPLVLGPAERPVRRIAWCTGGAQGWFEQAIDLGVDVFLTGEVSEQNHHLAVEAGVGFIAAGHHATERYGVQALGEYLAGRFGIAHRYIEIANPV
jgi:dinuclear metal center YbgI/SA1388 family protein